MTIGNFRQVGNILSSILQDWAENFSDGLGVCSAAGTAPSLAAGAHPFNSASHIHGVWDCFEMLGITASPIIAGVVDLGPGGDFSTVIDPRESVRQNLFVRDCEQTVPVLVEASLEVPAPTPQQATTEQPFDRIGARIGAVLEGDIRQHQQIVEGENVIFLEDYRRDHPRLTNNSAIANHASASAAMPSK